MVKGIDLAAIYRQFAALDGAEGSGPTQSADPKMAEVIDEVLDYQCKVLDRRAEELQEALSASSTDDTIAALVDLRIASLEIAATFQKLADDTATLVAQGLLKTRK